MKASLLWLCCSSLSAYQLISFSTQPETVHIGDRTRVILMLELSPTEQLAAPTLLPQSAELELAQVSWQSIEDQQVKLELLLYPWRSGTLKLAPLTLGNLSLEPLSLEVASVLTQQNATFRPERAPLMPKGTSGVLLLSAALIVLLPSLLYLGMRHYSRPLGRQILRWMLHLRDVLRLLRALAQLRRYCYRRPVELSCKILSIQLRAYLASRLKRPCQSYSCQELRLLLHDAEEWMPLFAVLDYCDQVRYAQQLSSQGQYLQKLRQLHLLVPRLSRLEALPEYQLQ